MSCSTNPNPFGKSSSRPFGVSYTPTFSSNTTSNASSSPTFNSVMPAFGVSHIPAFGGSSSPVFGSSSKSAFGASSSPAFGDSTTPSFSFGTSTQAFGQSISAFGTSSPFFGGQSSAFGSRTPTQTFENTGIGQSEFGGQRGGSRVPSYSATTEIDGGFGKLGKYESISNMSAYKDKSHEELRWEDYQLGDKGSQTPTQAFGNTGIGQSGFGGQRGGSRVASYSATTETDGGSAQPGRLESISAMPVYKDKSHEELRWEDNQLRDKGGPLASAPQSTGMAGFNSSTTQTNAFSPSPAFGQSSANPFSSTTPNSNNPFSPKTSTFSTGFATSTPAFSSSVFGSSTSAAAPSIFGSTPSPFGANSSSQPFNSSTSPFGANTSSQPFGSSTSSTFGSSVFGNTQPSPLFNSSAPTNTSSGSTFGQNTSPFGQTGAFSQPSSFSLASSGLVGSIFSNSAPLTSDKSFSLSPVFAQSSANPFSSTTPNFNNPFAPKTSTFSSGYGTSAPAFSSSAFDSSTTSAFGTSSSLASGASSIPAFGFCSSTEACGQSSSTSAFGGQSSVFRPQNHTQAFVNTGIGQPRFVGHRCGSRVASYSATTEKNSDTSGQIGKLNSISAMPFYKDKSHEELRWEDYQLETKAFGQSSSLPFGSPQSVFGQQNNSSINPSVYMPFGSPTPLGLYTGNSSTSAGVFGATQTLSPFSSNTTSSALSSPAFNSSMPASGASSTPASGNSSAPFGGLSVFGQKPAFGGFRITPTQTSSFGSAMQPPQPAFGSNTQQSQPAFGSSIFDSSIRFCASSQPVFSSSSTPAFRSTNTPAYGATTPAFSFGTSTQAFGQSSSAFGTSSPFGSTTSAFGGQSSAFGSQTPTQAFGNTGIGQSGFGGQRGGSRVASYSATTETDGGSAQPGRLESISAMPVYKDKSHEELRWEDNQLRDKGGPLASAPQSTGIAGFKSYATQTNAFSPSLVFAQSLANPFSSTTPNSNNPFAPKTSTFSSGHGTSAPAFSSSAFGSSSTSVFGTSSSLAFGASSIPAFSFFPSTEDKDLRSSEQTEKLESISAILVYKDKSHEELRWEDYQLGSSAPTNAQSGSQFGQNTSPFGQTAGFRPSSFFSSLSSGLVGSILSSRASLTSNAPDWAVSYQGRGSMVSLAILTGTVFATVAVSGWISLRCRRA